MLMSAGRIPRELLSQCAVTTACVRILGAVTHAVVCQATICLQTVPAMSV